MKKLIEQFMKFGIVGLIAFFIDYGLLMILSQIFGLDPVISAAVSFLVSLIFNYLASMKYVFKRRDDMSRKREFAIFCILSIIGLGINELIIWAGVVLFGSGALAVTGSKVVSTVIVAIWNFVMRKKLLEAHD
jgi:putative flippase GtrA